MPELQRTLMDGGGSHASGLQNRLRALKLRASHARVLLYVVGLITWWRPWLLSIRASSRDRRQQGIGRSQRGFAIWPGSAAFSALSAVAPSPPTSVSSTELPSGAS